MSPDEVVIAAVTTRQHDQPLGQPAHRRHVSDRADQLDGQATSTTWATFPLRAGSRADGLSARPGDDRGRLPTFPTGYALVNGRRAVYILATKRADASTLSVVDEVKTRPARRCRPHLPDDIHVSFEFDQSPYVTRAIWGLAVEGLLGAVLTGLMVLLFLRDWRSVLVVVLNIPLALMAAVVGLWLYGQDDQPDDAGRAGAGGRHSGRRGDGRSREHPHAVRAHRLRSPGPCGWATRRRPFRGCWRCSASWRCSCRRSSWRGRPAALFVPLSLAVGFSMMASYILSSTFVPVLSVWLLRHVRIAHDPTRGRLPFARLRDVRDSARSV